MLFFSNNSNYPTKKYTWSQERCVIAHQSCLLVFLPPSVSRHRHRGSPYAQLSVASAVAIDVAIVATHFKIETKKFFDTFILFFILTTDFTDYQCLSPPSRGGREGGSLISLSRCDRAVAATLSIVIAC